jgi:SAM-dependent methyltransferase
MDRVVSIMALMDSPGLPDALRAFRRVLRPGGELVFSVTHPVIDRPSVRWETDEAGVARAICVRDYFATAPWRDRWQFRSPSGESQPMLEIASFPRRIGDYVNGLIAAGFELVALLEPPPSDEACERAPELARWRVFPFYLMIRARSC